MNPSFSGAVLIDSDGDCDDDCRPAVLELTDNAVSMLRYLRKEHAPRHLWVDALSLNQADAVEMATHVPLIGEIFR